MTSIKDSRDDIPHPSSPSGSCAKCKRLFFTDASFDWKNDRKLCKICFDLPTTVLAHGCWDVLHAGHLKHLEAAKTYGHRLIVSVTPDRFVNKGPGRPYFTDFRRAEMLRSLRIVDEVVVSDGPTAVGVIRSVKPDFYVKGSDYKDFSKDVTGEILNEKKAIEEVGGKLVFTDEETWSSSEIINRFFQGFSDEQKKTIEAIKELGGIAKIREAIDELAKINVLVVGEPILDIYRFCQPEGISSKSPSISARFLFEETYEGGILAIGNHIKDFCKEVTLQAPAAEIPKKIRYISGNQRIFEVTHIEDQLWQKKNPDHFCDKLYEHGNRNDVVIAADFGHGVFQGQVLETMERIQTFIGLNVQTNSSNFGFNTYRKHTNWNYLCLDTREARLALRDRYSSPLELFRGIHQYDRMVSLTTGPTGSMFFDGDHEHPCPAFSDIVVDATGAGDAYFAITTCLIATHCHPVLVGFIGNVYAGLKCKIVGNKSSVSKAALLKACGSLLK